MKITCLECQNYEFEIKISDFELEETGLKWTPSQGQFFS